MKKLTAKDLRGYLVAQYEFESDEIEFYENAMKNRQEGTAEYESFHSVYYGHIHTRNLIYDLIKLVDKLED